jgi:hypothetical protein
VGVSIYYTATRAEPISSAEQFAIDEIISRYSVEMQIDEYLRSGHGFNWESFFVYDPDDNTEPDVVFEGATRLPSNSRDAPIVGLRRWCKLLTEIRLRLPGCNWRVHVDDYEIKWDDATNSYDPAQ